MFSRCSPGWMRKELVLFHSGAATSPDYHWRWHITQHLSSMANQAGFQVVVIDPRSVFASQQRFSPDIDLQLVWPSDYFADHHADSRPRS